MLKSVKIFFALIGKDYISSMKTILIIIGLLLVQTINTQDLNKSHTEKDSCEKIETTEIISGSVIVLSFIKGNQSSNTNDKPDFLRTGRNGSRKGKPGREKKKPKSNVKLTPKEKVEEKHRKKYVI